MENVNKVTLLDFLNVGESVGLEEKENRKNEGEIVLENLDKPQLIAQLKDLLKNIEPQHYFGESWTVNYTKERANRYWLTISKFQLSLHGKIWNIIDNYDSLKIKGVYETCELCGHTPCRDMYVISPLSKKEYEERVEALKMILPPKEFEAEKKKFSLTIGNECVVNYLQDEEQKKYIKSYRRIQEKLFNFELIGDLTSRIYAFKKIYFETLDFSESIFLRDIIQVLARGDIPTKKDLIRTIEIIKKYLSEVV
jgi:uncharacterized protein with HEPN domain